ncbi:hypothetical protein IJT17_02005 [bacterium]|nr:hypothetical protein [bacterium]
MVGTGLRGVSNNTPVAEVIRLILESENRPMSVMELTERLKDAWGRNLPCNPYDDCCIVYKIAAGVLQCEASFENVEGGRPPVVSRINPDDEPVAVSPGMRFEGINQIKDDVKNIMLTLPH